METQAQPLLERALVVRETGLRSLQQESDKLAWSRGRTELYRDLLKVELKLKTPAEALAAWEWYKGASLRPSTLAQPNAPSFNPSQVGDNARAEESFKRALQINPSDADALIAEAAARPELQH